MDDTQNNLESTEEEKCVHTEYSLSTLHFWRTDSKATFPVQLARQGSRPNTWRWLWFSVVRLLRQVGEECGQELAPLTLPCSTWPSLSLTLALCPRNFFFPNNTSSFWSHIQNQPCSRAVTSFSVLPWLLAVTKGKWILGHMSCHFLSCRQWMVWGYMWFPWQLLSWSVAMERTDEWLWMFTEECTKGEEFLEQRKEDRFFAVLIIRHHCPIWMYLIYSCIMPLLYWMHIHTGKCG